MCGFWPYTGDLNLYTRYVRGFDYGRAPAPAEGGRTYDAFAPGSSGEIDMDRFRARLDLCLKRGMVPTLRLEDYSVGVESEGAHAVYEAAKRFQKMLEAESRTRLITAAVEEEKPFEPEMVFVRGGTFNMGSPSSESGRSDHEGPVHEVSVSDFCLGKYEVTVGQFRAFVEATGYKTFAERENRGAYVLVDAKDWKTLSDASWRNPYFDQDERHPVTCLNWHDVNAYCKWLSRETGKTYRLPTEAEREYACRAGTTTAYYWGTGDTDMHEYANGADQSAKRAWNPLWGVMSGDDGFAHTAPVGSLKPNRFGLHDMSGNVWEWCADLYKEDYYQSSPKTDPKGPSEAEGYVFRGGSWISNPHAIRSAIRTWEPPELGNNHDVGCRVARDP
jgi:formylglycine-generating enzyme required for sulfatase activity